jgi:sulfate adenylyltransferase subunit 1 (EFTu-like GTPase family)
MMYALIAFFSLLQIITLHANWSSTAAKDLKQPVNFSGKLTTHQGQDFVVDNISIHGKYEKIPAIDKPINHTEPEMNSETKQLEIKLDANPNADFTKTNLDLNEIKEISVPQPNTIWIFQKKERSQKIEFIEIQVTTNSGTKAGYLLEAKTPIYCDAIDPAGPQEKTVPLSAVKTLTIEGYTYRDTSKDKDKKCKPNGCPACPVEKE